MRRFACVLSAGVSALSLSAAAYAQEGPPPTPEENTPVEQAAGEQLTQSSDEDQVAESAAQQGVDQNAIVVTGTLLRGAPPVGSNLISVGEERIQSTGATTANELLASIPQATNLFNNVPNATLNIAANQVQVVRPTLRNLGNATSSSSATLVLFDGHRIAPVGITQNAVDPDIIPSAAIERVEIVTDGGSATYGADAVGGVINFITRKRFDGLRVEGKYGFADDYYQVSASAIAGKDWGSGSVFASYSYQHNDALFGRDRDYIRRVDFSTPNLTPTGLQCSPGNVSVGPTTFGLPGLTSTTLNSCDISDDESVIPRATRHGAVAGLHQELADWLTVDLRAFYGERKSTSFRPFRSSVTVTPTNPFFRPIPGQPIGNQTVAFTFAPILGRNSSQPSTEFQEWGANAEFQADVNENWGVRTLFNYSRSNSVFRNAEISSTRLNAAGAATTPATAVNFYDLTNNPNLAVINSIVDFEGAGQGKFDLFNARTILDGTLFTLPGGDVKLAVGYEYEHDTFRQRINPTVDALQVIGAFRDQPFTPYRRRVHSAFGELNVPIVGADNRMGGIYSLTLAGSVRHDRFSDFGNTTNPKIGITYKPVSWLGLRGNYSTSFNAPSAVDQLGSQRTTINLAPVSPFIRAQDAAAVPFFTPSLIATGAQQDLQPQEAETYSFGIDIDPPFLEGLHASVNYYHVELTNGLGIPTPNAGIFTDFPTSFADPAGLTRAQIESLADVAPNAPQTIATTIASQCPGGAAAAPTARCNVYSAVLFLTGNYGTQMVEGLDFSVNYRMETSFGGIDAAASGNYQLTNDLQPSASSPRVVDQFGPDVQTSGRFNAQASLGVDIGGFRAQATLYHTSGFSVTRSALLPQDKVGAYDTVNLFFKYDVPSESFLLRDLSLTLNVNNVFDEDPPLYRLRGDQRAGNGFINGFTLGRLVQFGISKKF